MLELLGEVVGQDLVKKALARLIVRVRNCQMTFFVYLAISTTADVYNVDTSNVLFILSGSFVGLEKIVKQRLLKGVSPSATCLTRIYPMMQCQSIGFTANLSRSEDEGASNFVPFFTPNAKGPQTFSEMVEATGVFNMVRCACARIFIFANLSLSTRHCEIWVGGFVILLWGSSF